MLVLTRRSNQSIMIGDDVEVTVLGVSGEKVRLGITAPDEVAVFREEVYLRIASEEGSPGSNSGPEREDAPETVA
jgi:carbon storage regulator